MGIELSQAWRSYMEQQIASGAFQTEAEVVEAALSIQQSATALEHPLIQEAIDSGPAVEISFDEIKRLARARAKSAEAMPRVVQRPRAVEDLIAI